MSEVVETGLNAATMTLTGGVGSYGDGGFSAGNPIENITNLAGQAESALGGGAYEVDPYGSPYAGQQGQLLELLQAQAQGTGVSPTEEMLRQQGDKISGQARGFYESIPGLSQGLRARLAARQGQSAKLDLAGKAGTARLEEQIQGQRTLADYLTNLEGLERGTYKTQQDIGSRAFEGERGRRQDLLKAGGEAIGLGGL